MLLKRIAACALAIMMLCTAFALEVFAAGEPSATFEITDDGEYIYFNGTWDGAGKEVKSIGIIYSSAGFNTNHLIDVDPATGDVTEVANLFAKNAEGENIGKHLKSDTTSESGKCTAKTKVSTAVNPTVYGYAYVVYKGDDGNYTYKMSDLASRKVREEEVTLTHPDGATTVELTDSTVKGIYGNNPSVSDGTVSAANLDGILIALGGEYTSIKLHISANLGTGFRVRLSDATGENNATGFVLAKSGEDTVELTAPEACSYILIKGPNYDSKLVGTISHICYVEYEYEEPDYSAPVDITDKCSIGGAADVGATLGMVDLPLVANAGESIVVIFKGNVTVEEGGQFTFRCYTIDRGGNDNNTATEALAQAITESGDFEFKGALEVKAGAEAGKLMFKRGAGWNFGDTGSASLTVESLKVFYGTMEEYEAWLAANGADTANAVEAVESVETVETVETVEEVEKVEPIEPVKPVETVESVKTVIKRSAISVLPRGSAQTFGGILNIRYAAL